MTTQLLIYENATPITKDKHANLSVSTGSDYLFSKGVNSIPLMAVEFVNASRDYAIVFTGSEDVVMPAVILGVRNDENLYLTDEGHWESNYIPAFIRRYPFVFSSHDSGETFTLCIDENFVGCNQEGRGERLFDSEGNQTLYLNNVLEFLKEFQAQFQITQSFCQNLIKYDLLEPMQAKFSLRNGEETSLSGFRAISRDRLAKLSGADLSALLQSSELELIYLHLQSMRNFTPLVERMPTQ